MALTLHRAGYNNTHSNGKDTIFPPDSSHLKVKLLSAYVKAPTRSTPTLAGLDLYCPSEVAIEPHSTTLIATDIDIEPMAGIYTQIPACSNFIQKSASTIGGVVDPCYCGNSTIIMRNSSSKSIYIEQESIFTQLILKRI